MAIQEGFVPCLPEASSAFIRLLRLLRLLRLWWRFRIRIHRLRRRMLRAQHGERAQWCERSGAERHARSD